MELNSVAALPITSLLPVLLLCFPLLAVLLLRHASPRRLPPSPPSLPLIGHLHHLLSSPSPPHHVFARLAADLNTDILLLRLGRVPTLVVSSPSLACEVLKTQDHALASRPALLSAQYLSFGCSDVTFSPLGPYWRQARRICVSELLSPRRVASFGVIRRQEVDHLLRSLVASPGETSRVVDMSERFFKLANDVLCRVAFGRRFEKREEDGRKKKGLVEVLEETQRLFAGFDAGEFFPGLVGEVVNAATGLRGRLERNLADLRAVCDEIIQEHGEAGGGGGGVGGVREEREDFVDVLLRVQKGGGLEVPITDDNLKALVLV
ncbi:hypothetical protein Taro_053967, partial [Colocasia esculenta]|nr:hypothetical protein [Colocasia esculenta]